MHYLTIKYNINKETYKENSEFITDLYAILFTEKMINSISQFVEENYTFNLDEKEIQKYNEGLQFTDFHAKILHKISTGMKIAIPLILEYAYFSKNVGDDLSEFLLLAFDPLFDIFEYEVDILNKLYQSVYSRVITTRYSDCSFWYYVRSMGFSIEELTQILVKKLIIDIIPKYQFDKNIISLNHVVINNNIEYTFRYNFPLNFKPLNLTDIDDDGLSDFDKLAINTARVNESFIVLNKVNIDMTINYLLKKFMIKLNQKEIDYYLNNDFKINKLQRNMLFLFFSKYFGSTSNLYSCNIEEYIKLLVIMKKILEKNNFILLQKIILGRVEEIFERKALGKKYMMRVIESKKYKCIMNKKYNCSIFNVMDSNIIIKLIATIINNKFTLFDYNNKEKKGKEISVNIDVLCNEFLRFIEMI